MAKFYQFDDPTDGLEYTFRSKNFLLNYFWCWVTVIMNVKIPSYKNFKIPGADATRNKFSGIIIVVTNYDFDVGACFFTFCGQF